MVLKIAEKKKKKKKKDKKKKNTPGLLHVGGRRSTATECGSRLVQQEAYTMQMNLTMKLPNVSFRTPFPSYQLTMTLWTNNDWITNDTHDGHEKSSNKNEDEKKNKNCYCSCSCCYCSYSYSFCNFRSPLARELLVYMHKDTLHTSESPCILGRIGKTLPSIWQKVE